MVELYFIHLLSLPVGVAVGLVMNAIPPRRLTALNIGSDNVVPFPTADSDDDDHRKDRAA